MQSVNIAEKFGKIQDYWTPRIIGELNDFAVKALKLKGESVWHYHDNEDELCLVLKGSLRMRFREGEAVVHQGEFPIVPHGVEHQPAAEEDVHLILLGPKTTLNTGNISNERTVRELERI